MKKSFVFFIVILLISFSAANSKTYKSSHNITMDIPTGYFLTSTMTMENIIKMQEEDPNTDIDRLKQIMKEYKASDMKIEYIIDIKDPYGFNAISIASDTLESSPLWKWKDINNKYTVYKYKDHLCGQRRSLHPSGDPDIRNVTLST